MTSSVGGRIKEIRKKLKKTQLDIAKECQCTVSFVSKLEHGHTDVSLNMLHRIATSLHVNIGTLLPSATSGESRIVRAADRLRLTDPSVRQGDGIQLEPINPSGVGTQFQVNLHHVAPKAHSDGQITHVGEEFIYVLRGMIDLHLALEVHRLEAGDAAFFSSSEPHGYANPGDEAAIVLWLNSPPTY